MSYPDPDPHRRAAPQGQPYGPPIVPGPPPGQYPPGLQQQPWAPQQPGPYPNQGAAGYPPQRPPQGGFPPPGAFPPPGPTVVAGNTHKPKRRRWPLIVAVIVVAGVCIGVGSALINSGTRSNTANDATVSSPTAGAAGAQPTVKSTLPDREICRVDTDGGTFYLLLVSAASHRFDDCAGHPLYPGAIDALLTGTSGMDRRCLLPTEYTVQHEALGGVYSDRKSVDLTAARQFCASVHGTDNA